MTSHASISGFGGGKFFRNQLFHSSFLLNLPIANLQTRKLSSWTVRANIRLIIYNFDVNNLFRTDVRGKGKVGVGTDKLSTHIVNSKFLHTVIKNIIITARHSNINRCAVKSVPGNFDRTKKMIPL